MNKREMAMWARYAMTHVSIIIDDACDNGFPEEDEAFVNNKEAALFVRECMRTIARKHAAKGMAKKELVKLHKLRDENNSSGDLIRCMECGAIRTDEPDCGVKCPNCESL